jgi:hypothetical protein
LNIFQNPSLFNDKTGHYNQLIIPKNIDQCNIALTSAYLGQLNMASNRGLEYSLKSQNKSNSFVSKGQGSVYIETDNRKLFASTNMNNFFRATKDIIKKNTPNHITSANYIKSIQEKNAEYSRNEVNPRRSNAKGSIDLM